MLLMIFGSSKGATQLPDLRRRRNPNVELTRLPKRAGLHDWQHAPPWLFWCHTSTRDI
jgi:hypothetical protein